MRKNFLFIAVVLLILGMSGILQATMCGSGSRTCPAGAAEEPELVGNTICPISGEEIVAEKAAEYEYEGKIYSFCCLPCIEEFKKDPQKYIEEIQKQAEGETS